ncbi:hypothetical protein DEO72_LG7g1603 [Vigna unguiculata]|uniref:Uncharacterized protein n=1 Tax=Vigna unguiculata TaxID=3917 RepID=A0A4D6MFW0_VIGUN|nr:hypothetical protein DEO72_LG7g1603 [Vigna unguiculata]
MAVSLSVNRPLLRLHHKQPSLPVGVAPQLHFHRQPKLAGIRCSSSPSHFTDKTLISIKPNTSHLNHDPLVCRFNASQFGGTGTVIYPAATVNNITVLDDMPQHPPLNALRK